MSLASIPLPALVLADVHHRFERAEEIISAHGGAGRSVVFLGDYFDSHEANSTVELHLTARWLRQSVRQPNRTHLLGNHDVSYFYPRKDTYCSGWNEDRQQALDESFGPSGPPRERFQLAATAGPWLLSHAGFSGRLCRDADTAQLLHWADTAHLALGAGTSHPLLACGRSRGGSARDGGLYWLDWDDEFTPLVGLHQLVGHTPGATIRGRHQGQGGKLFTGHLANPKVRAAAEQPADLLSVNWALDTGMASWAVIHEDHLELHDRDGVTLLPAPLAKPATHPELAAFALSSGRTETPPAYVSWTELDRVIASPEASAALRKILRHVTRPEGPAPSEAARALRSLQRHGQVPAKTPSQFR